METLSLNGSATKIAEKANRAEVTLGSPSQPDIDMFTLGESVKNVLSPTDIISADYVPPPNHEWFFMFTGYRKNTLAQERLQNEGIFSYIPYETIKGFSSDGKRKLTRKPIFSSYIFVFAPLDLIKLYTNTSQSEHSLPFLHFVYNRTLKNEYGLNVRMTISHKAMVNFMRLAEFDTYKVHSVDEKKVHFVKDEPVRITEGVFKGIEGRVARIHNQTTVVVTLEGIASMTTAYIPKQFMESISPVPEG